jgi:hypothetical protein
MAAAPVFWFNPGQQGCCRFVWGVRCDASLTSRDIDLVIFQP